MQAVASALPRGDPGQLVGEENGRLCAKLAVGSGLTSDGAHLSWLIADACGHVFNGAFNDAGPVISRRYELAERLQQPHNVVRIAIVDALRPLLACQLDHAGELVDRSLRIADVSLVRPAHAAWLGLAAQLTALRGDLEQAQLQSYEAVRAASHVDDFGVGGWVRAGQYRALLAEIGLHADVDSGESTIGRARAELRLLDDHLVHKLVASAWNSGYVLRVAMEAVRRGRHRAALVIEMAQRLVVAIMAGFVSHASGSLDCDVVRSPALSTSPRTTSRFAAKC